MNYPFNLKTEEVETNETFSERVFQFVKRTSFTGACNLSQTYQVINRLAKYYGLTYGDIVDLIRNVEYNDPSQKYLIQYVQCLGNHYLNVSKRSI